VPDSEAPAADLDAAVRAGVAVYDAGHHHAAHDAWEAPWLGLAAGTDDERFLHGLIQFTAVVHHARDGNWSGAQGLAASAGEYLAGLPDRYRCVDLTAVRPFLDAVAADPVHVERASAPVLTCDGEALALADLSLDAALAAAAPLAEGLGLDEDPVADAVAYARRDLDAGDEGSRFVALVWDFVRADEGRALVYDRLRRHVERRRSRERDVDGLF
jgi:hypothetical protein